MISTGSTFPLAGITAGQKKTPQIQREEEEEEERVPLWVFQCLKCLQNLPEQLLIKPGHEAAAAQEAPGAAKA